MEGSEVTVLAALGAALSAMVYFSWSGSSAQGSNADQASARNASAGTSRNVSKKGKRRKRADTVTPGAYAEDSAIESSAANPKPSTPVPKVSVQRTEPTIPGGLAPILTASDMESSGEKSAGSSLAPPSASKAKQRSSHTQDASGLSEFDSESGWTRVQRTRTSSSRAAESTSDAGVTTSVTEEEGSVSSKREETLTSAEKLLPKAPKTAVDDMIDGPKPGIARVLRVPGPTPASKAEYTKPAGNLTLDDYEDGSDFKGSGVEADEEDSTWDVVGRKKRGGTRTPSTYASDTAPSTIGTSNVAPTKKQRQNAAKRQAEKDRKAAADKEMEAARAKHMRDLEKARIDEQYRGKKGLSGGMTAKVDSSGSLVWE
ncbi:hypothetical protein PIIN_03487 [Serendipita indica DSM 11827]|uniref:Uncharacterized protein n=1 Tax=Serendipita indica (strain DSM 11827) TaxID=1109443 RepID=G4TE05_SERID|nr:hypothetical protein PIIN_03487 [Serendipita indica DSM 11827]